MLGRDFIVKVHHKGPATTNRVLNDMAEDLDGVIRWWEALKGTRDNETNRLEEVAQYCFPTDKAAQNFASEVAKVKKELAIISVEKP